MFYYICMKLKVVFVSVCLNDKRMIQPYWRGGIGNIIFPYKYGSL